MATTSTTQDDRQQSASSGNTNRVWVGNLAYKSSEQELREAFAGMKM
jgi:RNA recognition motif-containing protein